VGPHGPPSGGFRVFFTQNYSIPKKHDGTEGEAMSKLKEYSRKEIAVAVLGIILIEALVVQIFFKIIS